MNIAGARACQANQGRMDERTPLHKIRKIPKRSPRSTSPSSVTRLKMLRRAHVASSSCEASGTQLSRDAHGRVPSAKVFGSGGSRLTLAKRRTIQGDLRAAPSTGKHRQEESSSGPVISAVFYPFFHSLSAPVHTDRADGSWSPPDLYQSFSIPHRFALIRSNPLPQFV